ncbi:MAG: FlgD immunoglobulin-like domain containing protein, partial [Verrucomicrobiota bacterium]
MKTTTRKLFRRATSLFGGAVLLAGMANAQNIPNFIGVSATDEQAIRLTWASISHEVYEIDEADSLIDNTNTGSITWNLLYDNYPSQGTNTFWLDTGNYNLSPQILHPKDMPFRFYRIVDLGPDSTSDEPCVSITSPTSRSAAVGELTVTVVAHTDQPVLNGTELYVDGQQMRPPDTSTNYTDATGVTNYEVDTYNLNTCEWGNETHTLFATVECESGDGDAVNSPPVETGHGVSTFVPVLFSNLITRISFSQPSFDPSSGQTQQVSAVCAANCNWTLTIRNSNSNEVRTTTGTGNFIQFNWDGTGDGETNLPTGIYYYYISAQTNGSPNEIIGGGSGGGGSPPMPMLSMADNAEQLYVVENSGTILPAQLYPPGFDTNGFNLIEASPSEVRAFNQTLSSVGTVENTSHLTSSASNSGLSYQANGSFGGSSA